MSADTERVRSRIIADVLQHFLPAPEREAATAEILIAMRKADEAAMTLLGAAADLTRTKAASHERTDRNETTGRRSDPSLDDLLTLPAEEKVRRFAEMVTATYSHVDGRDLLAELHPRKTLDIKRRVDGLETWFEGDWLSRARDARNGWRLL